MRKIKIDCKLVGDGEPVFVVAEAGVNHNGSIVLAKKLVDAAKNAGADAVKFQTFKTEKVVTEYAKKADYQKSAGSNESQYEMLRKLELKNERFTELFDYAKKKGIIFLSSAFDKESVDLLNNLGVLAFKIASGEITNFPLLRYIAGKKKPIILSTGMSTIHEISEALKIIRKEGVQDIILLHCVTSYPARKEDINLRVIETLRRKFKLPIGFSDHTLGPVVSIAAVALGAVLIEKHFTLDRNLSGPDHSMSMQPNELKEMIAAIHEAKKALGTGAKRLTEDEKKIKKLARRSVVARVSIRKGTIITESMLDTKRPGTGIDPRRMNLIIGKRTRQDIARDELITLKKLAT
jgi:N-acetylneuraminate synthase/N,N'-diacetyllegionaminate synthase